MTATCAHTLRPTPSTDRDGINTKKGGRVRLSWMITSRRSSGGNEARASDYQRVEVSWLLNLLKRSTQKDTKDRMIPGLVWELGEGEAGAQGHRDTHKRRTPEETTETWVHVKGVKGGANSQRNGGKHRHAALSTETSGRGWWVAGTGNV